MQKLAIFRKVKAGPNFNPPRLLTGSSTRIRQYSEELRRGYNAEIGPKDIFDMTSRILTNSYRSDIHSEKN